MSDQFSYDVFLSHNSQDRPRVRRLAEALRAAGLRVWFDEWVIQPGDDIYLAIERGLEASRTLLLCLSPAALGSDWVTLERGTGLFRDPLNTERRFIPLLLADCKLPDTLRRYKYVDYRDETEDAFAQVLASCRFQEQVAAAPVAKPARKARAKPEQKLIQQKEEWRHADDEVRKKLPPGVSIVRTLRGHLDKIYGIAWSPDGRMLASSSGDNTIRLWDAETGECLRKLEGHKENVWSVAFDPTGCTLASGSFDRTVKLWETASGKLLRTLEGHHGFIYSVAFHPEGHTLASGG
jgi:hypothetical protein